MADIAAQSLALSDGYGQGYRPTGSPTSPRFTVTKVITDNGNGTATVKLTVTCKTNNGYIGGGYELKLFFSITGATTIEKVWKAESASWAANSTYSTTIERTIPLTDSAARSADLWLTNANWGTPVTPFTWRASAQGGNEITGIMLLAGIVWVGNGSSAPKRGEVYVGNGSSVPVKAKEVWVGNGSSVPVKAKA